MKSSYLIVLLLVISSTSTSSTREQEEDRINELPGHPKVGFSQFSGYVTVNESHGRALFYWLTESASPQTKPLLLWLNGGPGCSSIGYGASEEIGPFRINKTGSNLYLNNFSWNTEANILFLESPVGVGFSYTNTSSDLKHSGDDRTAQENLIFLIKWMSRFPQYQYRDFYIAGESYAGHYIPQLAKKIHYYNKTFNKSIINLKGFMVGNGDTDRHYDRLGAVTYWWSHAMISDRSYNSMLKHCSFTENTNSNECDYALHYATVIEFGQINGGDTDSVVPVTATRLSISHLNLTVKTRWYPWYSGNQVGGWTEIYEGLTFATVRGAGHEVPVLQPERALILLRSFLAGKELPRSY